MICIDKENELKLMQMKMAWERHKRFRGNDKEYFDNDHFAFLTINERENYLNRVFNIIFDLNV